MPDMGKILDLTGLIEGLDWEDFEKSSTGDVFVRKMPTKDMVRFSLRVGLHMGRPSKAILAMQQFVRITVAQEYEPYKQWLHKLDPNYQDGCTYTEQGVTDPGHSHGLGTLGLNYQSNHKSWHPKYPVYQQPQTASQYGQYAGYNPPFYGPYTSTTSTPGVAAQYIQALPSITQYNPSQAP